MITVMTDEEVISFYKELVDNLLEALLDVEIITSGRQLIPLSEAIAKATKAGHPMRVF